MIQQTIISGVKNHRLLQKILQTPISVYFNKKKTPIDVQCVFQLFVIISEFLSLPNCRNWYQSFCSWEFLAGISLSASTSECFEFASLQLPSFLAFLPLISFYYREDQSYPNLKLSMQTMGILVCLGTGFFLWKFDWVYRRWDWVYRRWPLTLKPILHNKSGNRKM